MASKSIHTTFSFCRDLVNQINKRIKENENEKITKSDLAPLTEPFEEVIDFIKAFLIRSHDALYGSILMTMDTEIDYTTRSLVDLTTDGLNFKMKFNPLFIGNYNFSKFITLVVGEILRLIYEHMSTFAELNQSKDTKTHLLLEDASSASVASMLEHDIKLSDQDDYRGMNRGLSIPEDYYTVSSVIHETDIRAKDQESLEYYYKILEKYKKRQDQNSASSKLDKQNQQQSGSGNGDGDPFPTSGPMQDSQRMKDGDVASPNNTKGNQPHQWENLDPEKTSEQGKNLIYEAYNSMDADARGKISAGIAAQIQKLLAPPEISWKQVLRKFVGTIPFPYRHSRRRLNRLQPNRTDLCGRLPKRKVRIVCVFDTSGSMSDSDIAYCVNEVFHIAKANETEITIIECDAEVNRVYIAKKPEDVTPDVHGRGGTCFSPAIEYINKDGKYRDALMIYFTDGYGESEIPRPKTYRNMWVVLHDVKNLSVQQPYGEVKSLSMDKDYKKFKNRY